MRVQKKHLLDFIRSREFVTFRDIEDFFTEKKYDFRGDTGIVLKEANLVMWNGWNHRTCKAFSELVKEGKVILEKVSMSHAPIPPAFKNIEKLSDAEFALVHIKAR